MRKGMIATVLCLALSGCVAKPDSISLSAEKEKIQVKEPLEIVVSSSRSLSADAFEPIEDAQIVEQNGRFYFEAFENGVYSIVARQNQIVSNALIVDVGYHDPKPEEYELEPVPDEERPKTLDAGWVLADPAAYVDRQITVLASLPQVVMRDENGQPYAVALPADGNEEHGMLRLSGEPLSFGGCLAELDGVLEQREDGTYELYVVEARMVLDGAARNTTEQ